jgi:heme/copper-type cytochrome/quinol oxidase subunit 2
MATGCQDRLSTLHPAGAPANEIAILWWVLLAGSVTIFILVMGLLAAALLRHHPRDSKEASERFWIWGLGLAFPIVTLAILTVYGFVLGERLSPRDEAGLVTVRAEARQWVWSFAYADAPGRVTENLMHIPAGRPVDVEITSADVIHSFWVPRLAGKLDAIPGRVNVLRIRADQPGDYAGQSAEFSGRGYAGHVFTLRAHDETGWAAFIGTAPP